MNKQPQMPDVIWIDAEEGKFCRTVLDLYLYERGTKYIRADLVTPAEPLDVEGVK